MLHVQVVSTKAEEMVKEAEHFTRAVGGNLYIEVPVISESIKAIKILKMIVLLEEVNFVKLCIVLAPCKVIINRDCLVMA